MKSTILILIVFLAGLIAGWLHLVSDVKLLGNAGTWILYALMFLVGLSIGSDRKILVQFRRGNLSLLVVPFTVLAGTLLGMIFYHFLFSYPHGANLFAIGSGLGYYSLSSILISKVSGNTIGVIALMANLIRELITLIFAPLLARYFGKLAPIASAGATSSDTTLPVILKFSGKEYILLSMVNGIVLTLLVPVIIALIYWI